MALPMYNSQEIADAKKEEISGTDYSSTSANLRKFGFPQLPDRSTRTGSAYTSSSALGSSTRVGSIASRQTTQVTGAEKYAGDLTSSKGSSAARTHVHPADFATAGVEYPHQIRNDKALGYTKAVESFIPAHVTFDSRERSSCMSYGHQGRQDYQYDSSTDPKAQRIPNSAHAQAQLRFLGYKQEFNRHWGFWSSFSLSYCNVSVLQGSFSALSGALEGFGPVIMTCGFFVTSCMFICLSAVFAEMASSFPVAGAMFTWTFKLARANPHFRHWARFLSWIVGFSLFSAHLLLQVQIGYDFGSLFTTLITASGVDWDVTWCTTGGLAIAYIGVCGLISTTSIGSSPMVWRIMGVISVILHFAVCIALIATSSHQRTIKSLFSSRKSKLGFKSQGWSLLVSWATTTVSLGSETAAHMAEETKDPASTVPRVTFWGHVFSSSMQVLSNICVTLAITPMRHKHQKGLGVINAVFWHCPKPVAHFIVISLVFSAFIADISQFLATSRFFWSLARDKALPFAKFWRKVTPDRRPMRATLLFVLLSMILCSLALEPSGWALRLTRGTSANLILIAYMIPIILYLCAPKDVLDHDGRNVWTLRNFSQPLACLSLGFLALLFIIFLGPASTPITTESLPWSSLVMVGVIGISVVTWFMYGYSHFAGPVKSLTIWTAGHEVEIPKCMPGINPRQDKHTTHQRTQGATQEVSERGAADLTDGQVHTFNVPQTYCTYDSDGSLWTPTASPDQTPR